MANPFGSDDISAGYATARPPVHPRVMERVAAGLGWKNPARRALDLGCGAGVSTRALRAYARQCIGIDPALAMLQRARGIAPDAQFLAGKAEEVPLGDGCVDVITAAGSLNYADLEPCFREAARVLAPQGVLVVYDFAPGMRFADASGLEHWFAGFRSRYPEPPNEARKLSPEILAELSSGFMCSTQTALRSVSR